VSGEIKLAYLALGSNVGDREIYLANARAGINELPLTQIVAESAVEETDPIGSPGQGRYLNQMLAVKTALSPHDLLYGLHDIERANGRVRNERWGARTLDIDIVLYGNEHIDEDDLKIPHVELKNRDFWQRELQELGVNMRSHAL
jgi:2-amino-4-hydroxy-6-hydroxymethyldihydropteridine diphosphokinase